MRSRGERLAALHTPDLPVLMIPHPSPTYVCTAPEVASRIRAGLRQAGVILRTCGAARSGGAAPE